MALCRSRLRVFPCPGAPHSNLGGSARALEHLELPAARRSALPEAAPARPASPTPEILPIRQFSTRKPPFGTLMRLPAPHVTRHLGGSARLLLDAGRRASVTAFDPTRVQQS